MSRDLVMKFLDEEGKKYSLRLNDVREDTTEQEIDELMDIILEKNIFQLSKYDLVKKDSAQIVNTNVEEYDLKY